jgi:hypothetical protein
MLSGSLVTSTRRILWWRLWSAAARCTSGQTPRPLSFSQNTNYKLLARQQQRVVTTKSTVFWDVTLCSSLEIYRRFGGTRWVQFKGRRGSQARSRFLLIFDSVFGGSTFFRNVGCLLLYYTLYTEDSILLYKLISLMCYRLLSIRIFWCGFQT